MDEIKMVEATSNAAKAMMELLNNLFGQSLKPHQMRKTADAIEYFVKKVTNVLNENSNINISIDTGMLKVSNDKDNTDFIKRAITNEINDIMLKQYNKETIVGIVQEELNKIQTESKEEIDKDWIYRFFESAEKINDEDMQYLWAKLLIGEFTSPKSFSYRLIDFLEKLTKNEINIINKVLRNSVYCNNELLLYKDDPSIVIDKYCNLINIKNEDITLLEDLGLIIKQVGGFNNDEILFKDSKYVISGKLNDNNKRVWFYKFTGFAKEIRKLINLDEIYDGFVKLCTFMKDKMIDVCLYEIKEEKDGYIYFSNKII